MIVMDIHSLRDDALKAGKSSLVAAATNITLWDRQAQIIELFLHCLEIGDHVLLRDPLTKQTA